MTKVLPNWPISSGNESRVWRLSKQSDLVIRAYFKPSTSFTTEHHSRRNKNNKADVLICGSGPAGLSAATWPACYGIDCENDESCSGPFGFGHPDGAQVQSIEIFDIFGIGDGSLRMVA